MVTVIFSNAKETVIFNQDNGKLIVSSSQGDGKLMVKMKNLLATSAVNLATWLEIVLKKGVIINPGNAKTMVITSQSSVKIYVAISNVINVAKLVIWRSIAHQEAATTISQDNATLTIPLVIDVGKLAIWLVTAANSTLVKTQTLGISYAQEITKVYQFVTAVGKRDISQRTAHPKRTLEASVRAINVENLGI